MRKFYNHAWMQIIVALCTFSFMACQEFTIDSQPEGPLKIEVDALAAYTVLATSPSNVVFNVSSNTPWKITSDKQWCKPTPAMSAASSLVSEIVVSFDANTDKKARTATLSIQAEGIEGTKLVTITQASKEDLVVIPNDELVVAMGGTISFSIISNKPWRVIPSTQFVGNIDKMEGQGNEDGTKETINIIVPENPAGKRSGTITVKTDYQEYSFTVTQEGIVLEQEDPSESGTIDFGWSELEKTIKIRANKAWKATVPEEYAEWIKTEEVSGSELKITLKPNSRLVTRNGQVLLSMKEFVPGFEGVLLDLTQAPQFDLGSVIVDEETGNVKIIKGSTIVSKFLFRKGHLSVDFEDVNFAGTSCLLFNMTALSGMANTNFYFRLRSSPDCAFVTGGTGFKWAEKKFVLTTEQVKAVRKLELFVEDDPALPGKLLLRVLLDGVEKTFIKATDNGYVTDPDNNPGQRINIKLDPAIDGEYCIIKNVTYESLD